MDEILFGVFRSLARIPVLRDMASGGGLNLPDSRNQIKTWRDIWSAGHGVGAVKKSLPVVRGISQLVSEYEGVCPSLAKLLRSASHV